MALEASIKKINRDIKNFEAKKKQALMSKRRMHVTVQFGQK